MKHILVGAVESSRAALEAAVDAGHSPAAVVALPEERRGRHSDYVDMGRHAEGMGIPVVRAANVNAPEALATLRDLDPDVIWVIGWSQLCREEFLAVPRLGCVGYHPSRLPENRGRGVIPWTILQGATETGGTLFWLDEGMDSGDVLVQEAFPVSTDETARSLYDKHLLSLRRMVSDALSALAGGSVPRRPQDHSRATWCARRTDEDGRIQWTVPASEIWTLIRAVGDPYPGAHFRWKGATVRVESGEVLPVGRYWGRPGQIQRIETDRLTVSCGRPGEAIRIRVRRPLDEEPEPGEPLKLHETLG